MYLQCVDASKKNLGENDTYTVHEDCPYKTLDACSDRRLKADNARFELIYNLHNDKNSAFIDADTIILKTIDFPLEKGKVYFYKYPKGFEPCAILPNGCKDFFERFVTVYRNTEVKNVGWYMPILKNNPLIKEIPDGYFFHLSVNSIVKAMKNTNTIMVANRVCSASRKNGEIKLRFANHK